MNTQRQPMDYPELLEDFKDRFPKWANRVAHWTPMAPSCIKIHLKAIDAWGEERLLYINDDIAISCDRINEKGHFVCGAYYERLQVPEVDEEGAIYWRRR